MNSVWFNLSITFSLFALCVVLTIGCQSDIPQDVMAETHFSDMGLRADGSVVFMGTIGGAQEFDYRRLVRFDSRNDSIFTLMQNGTIYNPMVHFNSFGDEVIAYHCPLDTARPSEQLVINHYKSDSLIFDKHIGFRTRLTESIAGPYGTSYFLSYYRGIHQGELTKYKDSQIRFRKEIKSDQKKLLPKAMAYHNDSIFVGGQLGTPQNYDGHDFDNPFFGTFLSMFDNAGSRLWYKEYEPSEDLILIDLAVVGRNFYVSYNTISDSTDRSDIRVVMYDLNGDSQIEKRFKLPNNQMSGELTIYNDRLILTYSDARSDDLMLSVVELSLETLEVTSKLDIDVKADIIEDVILYDDRLQVLVSETDTNNIHTLSKVLSLDVSDGLVYEGQRYLSEYIKKEEEK